MARKKEKQPVTLLIVPPHPERAPVSLRFPTWALPVFLLLLLAFFLSLGYFVDTRINLERELAQYRRIVELESSRQDEMRDTILAQQDEVKRLSEQITEFQADLVEVDRLTEQVRQMMNLATPTPTVTATTVVTTETPMAAVGGQSSSLTALATPEASRSTSSRGGRSTMGLVDQNVQEIARMEAVLPLRVDSLGILIEEANRRLERIEPEKRTSKEQLEYELRLLAAAPHTLPLDGNPKVASGFGYRTLNGVREFHTGIDYSVWYGNPVKATKDGVVVFAGWDGGYGWTVKIEHDMGFMTLYAHNSSLLVKKGDKVQQGQVIAKSGSTGRSTGPHLHYEIILDGKPVDPTRYIGLEAQQ